MYEVLSNVAESCRNEEDIPPEFELDNKLIVKNTRRDTYLLEATWSISRDVPDEVWNARSRDEPDVEIRTEVQKGDKMVTKQKVVRKTLTVSNEDYKAQLSNAFEAYTTALSSRGCSPVMSPRLVSTPDKTQVIGEVDVTTDKTDISAVLSRLSAEHGPVSDRTQVSKIKFRGNVTVPVGNQTVTENATDSYEYTVVYKTDSPHAVSDKIHSLEEYAEMVASGQHGTTKDEVLQRDTYYESYTLRTPEEKQQLNPVVEATIRNRIQNHLSVTDTENVSVQSEQFYLDESGETVHATVAVTYQTDAET